MMEIRFKDRLKRIGLYGPIKNFEGIYQRVTNRLSVKASGATVASFTPYEVSNAHKAVMLELERKRSQASAETYHQNPR